MEEVILKICGGCKKNKPFKDFYKSKRGRLGLHNHCKSCCNKYRNKHIEIAKKENRYYKDTDKYRKKSADAKRKKYQNDPSFRQRGIDYCRRRSRTDKFKKWSREYVSKRKQYDLNYRLISILRSRVRSAIITNQARKITTTTKLIGCTIDELKKYLESKFQPGMTWENYGKNGWHIDHIRPCISFDLTKEEDQLKCFHYTNMQPLWAFDNFSKGDKWNG